MRRLSTFLLAFDDWPLEDQNCCTGAFEGIDFRSGQRGSFFSESTVYGRKMGYGLWLGFLAEHAPEWLSLSPDERVDRALVYDYVSFSRVSCKERTIALRLCRLYSTLCVMYPGRDWRWLRRTSELIARKERLLQRPVADTWRVQLSRRKARPQFAGS